MKFGRSVEPKMRLEADGVKSHLLQCNKYFTAICKKCLSKFNKSQIMEEKSWSIDVPGEIGFHPTCQRATNRGYLFSFPTADTRFRRAKQPQ